MHLSAKRKSFSDELPAQYIIWEELMSTFRRMAGTNNFTVGNYHCGVAPWELPSNGVRPPLCKTVHYYRTPD